MNVDELKQRLNNVIDDWADEAATKATSPGPTIIGFVEGEKVVAAQEEPKRVLPEGKRVVRTKTQGDRVFLLDDEKKTRHWVTSPEALANQGFEMGDVSEVEDTVLLGFQMAAPIYK